MAACPQQRRNHFPIRKIVVPVIGQSVSDIGVRKTPVGNRRQQMREWAGRDEGTGNGRYGFELLAGNLTPAGEADHVGVLV